MKWSLIVGAYVFQMMLFSAEPNSAQLGKGVQLSQEVLEEEEEELVVFDEEDFSNDDFLE